MKNVRTVIVMPDLIRHPRIACAKTPDLIRGRNDSLVICK